LYEIRTGVAGAAGTTYGRLWFTGRFPRGHLVALELAADDVGNSTYGRLRKGNGWGELYPEH
jgi:hypothetical protein